VIVIIIIIIIILIIKPTTCTKFSNLFLE